MTKIQTVSSYVVLFRLIGECDLTLGDFFKFGAKSNG
jgi:hypothetical protein